MGFFLSLKKEFIYGASLDDILAVYSEEISSGTENQNELGFCSRVVIPNKTAFLKYNHQNIVTRCETLQQNVTKTTNLYFYHKNHLGSVIAISNEAGKLAENYNYDVYGNIIDFKESLIGNDIYYTGREYDKEIGLYYNRARYYSPKLGRFIARDPIDIADDINLYAYVGNNPVMYVDLMGTEKKFIKAYDDYLNTKAILQGTNQQINKINNDLKGYKNIPKQTQSVLDFLHKQRNMALNTIDEKEALARELHYNRNKFNTNLPNTISDAREKGWTEVSLLGSSYLGSYYHQDSNIKGVELKFVSQDGHKEVIYDQNSNIVTTDEYLGTYNFYAPSDKALHTKYDVLPYKEWGNTPNDSNIN